MVQDSLCRINFLICAAGGLCLKYGAFSTETRVCQIQ